jgi:hypothetical protein
MSGWAESAERDRQEREHARQQECAREHRASWYVLQRLGNASAFNGYHWTPSAYSCCKCATCGRVWRTKAAYVADLPDSPPQQGSSPG